MFKFLVTYVVDILPFVILTVHFIDKWNLAKGNLWWVYILQIMGCLSTIAYNVLLVMAMQGNHKSILVFTITSLWTIVMSIMGIRRMLAENKTKCLPSIPRNAIVSPAKFSVEK